MAKGKIYNKTYLIPIPEVTCSSCTETVKAMLGDEIVVRSKTFSINVSANPLTRMAVVGVENFTNDEKLDKQIGDELVNAALYGAKTYTLQKDNDDTDLNEPEENVSILPDALKGALGLATGIPLMLTLMILSMLGIGLPAIAIYLIAGFGTLLTLYLGAKTYTNAVKKLFKYRSLNMDSLFAVGTLAALGVSIASVFMPWLPSMFDVGLLVFGFVKFGSILKNLGTKKMTKKRCAQNLPKEIEVLEKEANPGGFSEKSQIQLVGPRSIIIVRRGEVIPLDGICLEEETLIVNTVITGRGEDFPETIRKGDELVQGMVVPNSVEFIRVETTKSFNQSYLVKLDKIVDRAQTNAPIVKASDKILRFFVPAVFLITAAVTITTYFLFPPSVAIHLGVMLLVSACPCILGIVVPLAAKVGLDKATKYGIQFRSGEALQKAASIDTVVFDLNGTLTEGKPCVKAHFIVEDEDADTILRFCHLMEKESTHSFAKAICSHIEKSKKNSEHNPSLDYNIPEFQPNSGRQATINGDQYTLGNDDLMREIKADFSNYQKPAISANQQIVYLAKNQKIIGHFIIEDPLRPEAANIIYALKKQGKRIRLCTGASQETANLYAKTLGINPSKVHAGCKGAEAKEKYIKRQQAKKRRVAMIGDGTNDITAVVSSDFSVAIQSPSACEVVQSHAGATVNNQSLQPLVTLFHIAQETIGHIKQNLLFSLSYNVLAMVVPTVLFVSLGFMVNPALGAGLMFLQTALVLLNAYRVKASAVPALPERKQKKQSVLRPQRQSEFSPIPTPSWQHAVGQASVKEIGKQTLFGNSQGKAPTTEDSGARNQGHNHPRHRRLCCG